MRKRGSKITNETEKRPWSSGSRGEDACSPKLQCQPAQSQFMQHATCNTQHATRYTLHATYTATKISVIIAHRQGLSRTRSGKPYLSTGTGE